MWCYAILQHVYPVIVVNEVMFYSRWHNMNNASYYWCITPLAYANYTSYGRLWEIGIVSVNIQPRVIRFERTSEWQFCLKKLETYRCFVWCWKIDRLLLCSVTIHAFDGQTDRHTDKGLKDIVVNWQICTPITSYNKLDRPNGRNITAMSLVVSVRSQK